MNGICKTLDCYYGAIPADDDEREWVAVKVERDGITQYLSGPCPTIEEAEEIAAEEHAQDLEQHGQFGAGA